MASTEIGFLTEPVSSGSPFSITTSWSLNVDTDQFTFVEFEGMLEPMICSEDSHMLESTPASSDSVDMAKLDRLVDAGSLANDEDCKGLSLVHLLMAAAEAVGDGDMEGKDLAWVILARLKELVSPSQGTNLERLATHFIKGLKNVLQGSLGPNPPLPKAREFLYASQLFQEMSPCVKFGHFTVNQAIIEAVRSERGVHIIDYDIMDGMQWAPLIQALACLGASPALRIRITALARAHNSHISCASVSATGRRLAEFAGSIGLTFSFRQCRVGSDGQFRPSSVKLFRGEVVVVNCMLHLPDSPNRTPGSVKSFLSGALTMKPKPKVLTLVEEQGSHGDGFTAQFMDLLHHYSAIYDSMEASKPSQEWARALVESVFLGPRIESSLARVFEKGHSGIRESWSGWMEGSGFKAQPFSIFNHCQAKLLLDLFGGGYTMESHTNKLVLSWKTRPLLAASVWSPF